MGIIFTFFPGQRKTSMAKLQSKCDQFYAKLGGYQILILPKFLFILQKKNGKPA